MGWGHIENGTESTKTSKVDVTVKSNAQCQTAYNTDPKMKRNIIKNQICAGGDIGNLKICLRKQV